MAQLQDLQVDWVSLVDRASVRDPQAKSEPRRFLLYKRDGSLDTAEKVAEMKLQKGEPLTPAEQLAYLRKTNPHAAATYELAHPTSNNERGRGNESKVVKAMLKMDALRKSEDALPAIREHADREWRALALEHLGASNPPAAAEHEAARAA
jgi:hypothetical protein